MAVLNSRPLRGGRASTRSICLRSLQWSPSTLPRKTGRTCSLTIGSASHRTGLSWSGRQLGLSDFSGATTSESQCVLMTSAENVCVLLLPVYELQVASKTSHKPVLFKKSQMFVNVRVSISMFSVFLLCSCICFGVHLSETNYKKSHNQTPHT